MNPENDTALPISIRLDITRLEGFKKNWKKTREITLVNITAIIFIIKSLNAWL